VRPRSFASRDKTAANYTLNESITANLIARLPPWRASLLRPISTDVNEESEPAARRPLSEAALRALAEAEARREAERPTPREIGGRGGLDPTRYGDWEVKGLASDF
jgi:hypothetical protein